MHEFDRSPAFGPTRFTLDALFDRFVLTPFVDSWIYDYGGLPGMRRGGVSAHLEIGAQLAGHWRQRGAVCGDGLFQRGQVHVLNPGEAYDLAFSGRGRVVGLTVDLERLVEGGQPARELRVSPRAPTELLFELCGDVLDARRVGSSIAAEQVNTVLRDWVVRHCHLTEVDPVISVRREIETHFAQDLYLKHLAEVAAMRPETLVRRFARRYGLTPIQYRLRLRLNAASRLGWLHPQRSLRDIADQVGIPNPSYFHRLFRRYFGASPGVLRTLPRCHFGR